MCIFKVILNVDHTKHVARETQIEREKEKKANTGGQIQGVYLLFSILPGVYLIFLNTGGLSDFIPITGGLSIFFTGKYRGFI